MSRRTNDFWGLLYIFILLIVVIILVLRGCINGSIESPSIHHNSYTSEHKEWEKAQKRISKQIDRDIKNNAEFEVQVTCPYCHGIKNVPDLDNTSTEFVVKPCPTCNGKGWVLEKHHWGENN